MASLPPHPTPNHTPSYQTTWPLFRLWGHRLFPFREETSSRLPQNPRSPGSAREYLSLWWRILVSTVQVWYSWLADSVITSNGPEFGHDGRFGFRGLLLGQFERDWFWSWRVQIWYITASLGKMGRGLLAWTWMCSQREHIFPSFYSWHAGAMTSQVMRVLIKGWIGSGCFQSCS